MLKGNRKLEVDKLEVDCRKEQGKNTRREKCRMK
jgi:hypothetical protein